MHILTAFVFGISLRWFSDAPKVDDMVVMNMTFSDVEGPYTQDMATLEQEVAQVVSLIEQQTFGKQILVPRVINLQLPNSVQEGCTPPAKYLPAMRTAALEQHGIDIDTVKFRVGILPAARNFPGGCNGWKGVGVVGCNKCRVFIHGAGIAAALNHELGHNLGFPHSEKRVLSNSESPMQGHRGVHFNGVESAYFDKPFEADASDIYALKPLASDEELDGLHRLVSVSFDDIVYVIAYRANVGLDATLRPDFANHVMVYAKRDGDKFGALEANLVAGDFYRTEDVLVLFVGVNDNIAEVAIIR